MSLSPFKLCLSFFLLLTLFNSANGFDWTFTWTRLKRSLSGLLADAPSVEPEPNLCGTLTILHTNDVHGRFEQFNKRASRCEEKDASANKCYGGFPRMYSKVEEIRKTEQNVIWLFAGDYFQGTVWYTYFKWRPYAEFVNWFNHTAITLGNHEFDDGIPGLENYVSAMTSPVLAANIDASKFPDFQSHLKKSTIVDVGGCRVGIIGYTTPTTSYLSRPGPDVIFSDEVEAINAEIQVLKNQGVSLFIAVGHSGYDVDRKIAAEVPDIDVVVGGHTNTFLYTGTPPDLEEPVDVYPKVIEQSSGRRVPVVQAFAFGKYMGHFTVKISKEGEVTGWSGNPILLDGSVPQDEKMLAAMEGSWMKTLDEERKKPVGETRVFLSNTRLGESNLGDIITDSMIYMGVKQKPATGWTNVPIAVHNSGGIRAPINATNSDGIITMEDILTAIPFRNEIKVVQMKGKHIMEMMEFSAKAYAAPGTISTGSFLQVSGLRVTYAVDLYNPSTNRVVELLVRCGDCQVPIYEPIDLKKYYTLAVPNYMLLGGDNYKIKKYAKLVESFAQDNVDSDVLNDYLKNQMPLIYQDLEGRILVAGSATFKPVLFSLIAAVFIGNFLSNVWMG